MRDHDGNKKLSFNGSERLNSEQKLLVVISGTRTTFFMRVRSWLRMNAGGVLNTCKSNGVIMKPSE